MPSDSNDVDVAPTPEEDDTPVRHIGFWQALRSPQNRDTLRTLITFTVIMVSVPVATFYGLLSFVFNNPDSSMDDRMVWSGIGAVAAVQVVTVGYIVFSFSRFGDDETPEEKAARLQRRDEAVSEKFEHQQELERMHTQAEWSRGVVNPSALIGSETRSSANDEVNNHEDSGGVRSRRGNRKSSNKHQNDNDKKKK